MDIREFEKFVPDVLGRMRQDGYGEETMGTAEWVLTWFVDYCREKEVGDINEAVIADFCVERFGFAADKSNILPTQAAIRKPLLTALELYRTGTYSKRHQPGCVHNVPQSMKGVYSLIITDFISEQRELSPKTKERKVWIAAKFLTFVAESGLDDIADLRVEDVDRFIGSLSGYAPSTLRCITGSLRELLDWMAKRAMIGFSGRMAFPNIKASNRSKLLSYYTKEEIERMISCIDPSTKRGKTYLAVVSLLAFTGMRAGDVIALDLTDIDWDCGLIRIVQQKTGTPLDIPLPDEVRYPLIDYIRNARPDSAEDPDALFISVHAPHTRMRSTSFLFRTVEHCMKAAGIEFSTRHHGPHSLRHSLATNMLNADVPVCAISDVLGHDSIKTTEIYLTVDLAHARKLALEVPL